MVRTIRDERQLPLIVPESDWTAPDEFPDLSRFNAIGFDTETKDPGLNKGIGSSWALGDGYVLGYSLATPERAYYYPVRHVEGNGDADKIFAYLRTELPRFRGTIVGQNLTYDFGWSLRDGINLLRNDLYDTMYVASLLDEYRPSYSLESLTAGYGLPPKDETLLREVAAAYMVDPKAGLWRFPAKYVGAYAERDAAAVLDVRAKQLPQLEAEELLVAARLEHDLLPLNVLMRQRGVKVDLPRVEETKKKMLARENQALRAARDICGMKVEIWSGYSLALACQAIDLEYPRTGLDQPSFQKEWLEETNHPFTNAVRLARQFSKARRDFCEAMVEEHLGADSRVHAEMHPLRNEEGGTVAGRFSYSDPNLQQAPSKDKSEEAGEIGEMVRSLFVADEGTRWGIFDVSQQEPRFTVHFANLLGLPGAADAARIINEDPYTDFHQMVADITGLPRGQAKPINLGKGYGMGGAKLCRKLNLPTDIWRKVERDGEVREIPVAGEEGKRIIKQYDERFPFMKALYNFCDEVAQKRGYIKLIDGRRCRFPLYETPGWGKKEKALPYEEAVAAYGPDVVRAKTRDAMNRLIQGSSSVQLKKALLKIWQDTGVIPYLSVHDEVDTPIETDAQVAAVDECVRTAVVISVPFTTDIELGSSWGTASGGLLVDGAFKHGKVKGGRFVDGP